MRQENNTIVLEVLTVASTEVLGEKKPLAVASACRFSNAKGDMREVQSYTDIASTADTSARSFLTGLKIRN